jgi:hypothetical protein
MVYNRFHRVYPPAFQKAVRILAGGEAAPGSAAEFEIARALVDDFPVACGMREFLAPFRKARREHFADVLLQPLEYSYTVRGLAELGRSCGLELVAPAISQFDRPNGTFLWNLRFDSRQLQDRYDALPDVDRWHVANLLLAERSPWLWFYLRRIDSGARRIPERQVCEEFLESRFEPATAAIEIWVLGGDGKYKRLDKPAAHPPPPRDESLRAIVEGARGGTRMRDLIESNRVTCGFPEVNETRLRLTTPLFPSLVAVSD